MEKLREQIRELIKEELVKILNENTHQLNEGIDIDYQKKLVSFNPNHQDNVDTNDLIHPHFYQNNIDGETILSIFERKINLKGSDGNPLVYALKGMNDWKFANPNYDIFALLRRFVAVTKCLQGQFDTLILVPSNNQLNNMVFGYLTQIVSFKNSYSNFFEKISANEVYDQYVDLGRLDANFKSDSRLKFNAEYHLTNAIERMNKENNGVFSYKYITPVSLRKIIVKSMIAKHDEVYAEAINDKKVLVFDDTVTTGKTLSDAGEAIRETFVPKSITFLTLFSPLQKGVSYESVERWL